MRRIVRLSDLSHLQVTPLFTKYDHALEAKARESLVARDLRVNTTNGVVSNHDGWLSRYTDPSDFKPFESEQDILDWGFRSFIHNSCSRMLRGFEP